MNWLANTIAGRTILVLLVGIGSVLALSHLLYEIGLEKETAAQDTARLADRLVLLKQSIMRLPEKDRDDAAHALSGGLIEVHWSRERLATAGPVETSAQAALRERLIAHASDLAGHDLIIGSSSISQNDHTTEKGADSHHTQLISLQLEDGSWLNLSLVKLIGAQPSSPSFLLSLMAMMLGVVAVSILMGRWLTRPLNDLTAATRTVFTGREPHPVPEAGTLEVRELGAAINELQRRNWRLLKDKTQTLAAVSHDLHTPLTRLRLRLEDLTDAATRTSMSQDLDEMEQMLDSTLSYLKGEAQDESLQTFDLAAVLGTIVGDMNDLSHDVSYEGPRHLIMSGRRLALKRALSNVISNAVKYGHRAAVAASINANVVEVTVDDDGPGIPADELEAVFTPFYRIDNSRSKDLGGHGLGLTVARTVVRAHGGDVYLSRRSPIGLRVKIELPVAPLSRLVR